MLYWSDLYIESETDIDYLTNRIQPFVLFKLPDKTIPNQTPDGTIYQEMKGQWLEYPLGIFLLSSPERVEEGQEIYRDIEAYDGTIILDEDRFTERYTIKAGTRYDMAVINILKGAGIKKYNIETSDKTLPNDLEYEPGTSKIEVVNELLESINYTPIWVDEWGYFTSLRYIPPSDRAVDYEYIDDELSVTENGMSEEFDLYSVPNKWLVIFENYDGGGEESISLRSVYTNDSFESPTSTVNRGRVIVDYRTVSDIADQGALNEYTLRIANEASQVYGRIKFNTAIMPFHSYMDIIRIRNKTLDIDDKFTETGWTIPLETGGKMSHEGRRVVNI